jgi:hypothetical protein
MWGREGKSRDERVYGTTFGGDGLMDRVRKFFLFIFSSREKKLVLRVSLETGSFGVAGEGGFGRN